MIVDSKQKELVEGNPFSMVNMFVRMNRGESDKQIEKAIKKYELANLGKGKVMGECDSCGDTTVLVKEVSLCGPCCFGEADTAYGNF